MRSRKAVAGPGVASFALGLASLAGSTALAAVRYVDGRVGVDAPDCRVASAPCRTITYALRLPELDPGDRIFVAPGIYSNGESFPMRIPAGISVLAPGGPSVTSIVDADAGSDPYAVLMTLDGSVGQATGIEGFTIDGGSLAANRFGVWIESIASVSSPASPQPFVRGCVLRSFSEAGIVLATWGSSTRPGDSTQLSAVIEQNRVEGLGEPGGARTARGIYVVTISEDGRTIPIDHSLLRNNFVRDCGIGIELGTLPGNPRLPAGLGQVWTVLRHNTVVSSATDGIRLISSDASALSPAGFVKVELANNIIHGSGLYGIHEWEGDLSSTFLQADAAIFVANVVFANAAGGYFDSDEGRAYSSSAELNSLPDLLGDIRLNRAEDPLLGANGALRPESPCRDTAESQYPVLVDLHGHVRPIAGTPDIGADELLPLLRGALTSLSPVTPPMDALFRALPEYLSTPSSPFTDPDAGVLTDRARPVVYYRFAGDSIEVLRLTKDLAAESVRIAY